MFLRTSANITTSQLAKEDHLQGILHPTQQYARSPDSGRSPFRRQRSPRFSRYTRIGICMALATGGVLYNSPTRSRGGLGSAQFRRIHKSFHIPHSAFHSLVGAYKEVEGGGSEVHGTASRKVENKT